MTARLAAALVLVLPLPAAAQETVVTLEAPRPVRARLDQLRHADPAVRAAAAAGLGADDRTAPFVRVERLVAGPDAEAAAFRAALAPVEARAWARHADRAKAWARQRRLDLLCAYLAGCPEPAVAGALDLVLPVQQAIHEEALADALPKAQRPGFVPAGSGAEVRGWFPPADAAAALDPESGASDRGDGWTFDGRRVPFGVGKLRHGYGEVVAARDRLRLTNPKAALGWFNSVALANGPVEVLYARNALLVVDGDVEVLPDANIAASVVVATGSVTAGAANPRAARAFFAQARVHAGGAIDLPNGSADATSTLRAGEAVTVLRGNGRAVQRDPTPPYGIRFTSLADFGLRVEAKGRSVEVLAVEAWSPLARYGVRAGDAVTRVGFDATRTPDDLRRALRRGLMDESAVLHLTRGGERLTRVVYLDGIPERK